MSKFYITLDVIKVEGYQIFEVEAGSESQALEVFKKHSGGIVEEHLEVQSLEYADINSVSDSF